MRILLKSAYEPYDSTDGTRYLAETLWPEGVDAYSLSPFIWVQELAPSYDMKERALWKQWTLKEFREEYESELHESKRRSWFNRLMKESRAGTVTLLHRSRKKESQICPEDTSVYYLREFLNIELNKYLENDHGKSETESKGR